MTNRERPARGWSAAEIAERERVAASSYPPDSASDTDPDEPETLRGMGAHHSNGNGGEHRESYPERIPPADFGEEELPRPDLRTSRPPLPFGSEPQVSEQQISTALLLQGERLRLVEQQMIDQRFKALEKKLDDQALETKDNFTGLREQLIDRDQIAAGIRRKDREDDAAAHAALMTEMRHRTPGRLGLAIIVLLLAATACGAIAGAGALQDMAHDMREQQKQDR